MSLYTSVTNWICQHPHTLKFIPNCFMTQEVCAETVKEDPWALKFVPDHLKTHEMFSAVVHKKLCFVADPHKTQEICAEAIEKDT